MAETWWTKVIGKDLFWAGICEMVLFPHYHNLWCIVYTVCLVYTRLTFCTLFVTFQKQ
jgi:hypothetical protein